MHGHRWTWRRGWGGGWGGRGGDRCWEALPPTPQPAAAQPTAAPPPFAAEAPARARADAGVQHGGSGPVGHRLHGEQLGFCVRGQHFIGQVQRGQHLRRILLHGRGFQPGGVLSQGQYRPAHVQIPGGIRWDGFVGKKKSIFCSQMYVSVLFKQLYVN